MRNRSVRCALACLAVLAAACIGHLALAAEETPINVTGIWLGVNYTSKVPGPHAVRLDLMQSGTKVTGTFCVATGVCGKGEGTISGNKMEINWKNTTPSCPGGYHNTYLVSQDQMIWKFTGEDCLGSEQGHGYAKKEP